MSVRPDVLSHLENPPVVETVLSVQFAPIVDLTVAHIGWYWKNFLDASWVKVQEAPALDDQFEKFELVWKAPVFQLTAVDKPPVRIQISNAEDDRVIQIQNTRFIYNSRKREASYPSFRKTYPEFSARLEEFRGFLRAAGFGDIRPNQWELSYVDHIPKGDLWQTPEDWHSVLPGLYAGPRHPDTVTLESSSSEQHFEITPRRGRVHVVSRHGSLPEVDEILILHSTARGPVEPDQPDLGLDSGLRLGHEAVVRTFMAIASESALRHWGAK